MAYAVVGFTEVMLTALTTLIVNVAVSESVAFITTVHVEVPLHVAPLQPVKLYPAAAVAVRTTEAPVVKARLVDPAALNAMPLGLEPTVPLPTCVTLSA